MRKAGSVCDYIIARNEDLKEAFYARLGMPYFSTIDEIFRDISENAAARRFYISETRAHEMLRIKRKTGAWKPDMIENRRLMMQEIERRVEEKTKVGENYFDALFDVVNSQAPSFYLTPRSVRTLLYNALSQI